MQRKHLTEPPVCPHECLFIISRTTGLSFVLKRIGPLAAIIIAVLYLLAFYLFAISITPENPFVSVYSETFIETARQHLLLLVGFDTLIYRKYCDTPPILVGHHYLVDIRELEDRPPNFYSRLVREDSGDIFDETERP